MHFTVNNITRDTVQAKATLLKKDLIGKNIDYFCHFLVVRRVCMEPNNHDVYASFVAAVGSTPLTKCLVRTTYAKIQMLLSSDSIHTQASQPERTLLKHLGAWLGLLTLARNKPLLARSLDLKELIIDAYERSRLIAVIPFARQVLSSCAQSRIFKPPNPWLMAILSLLKEINDLPALQMKLKFEIEVLFRDLDIGKNNPIKASTVLRNRQVIVSVPTPAEEKKAPVAEPEAPRQPLTRASDPGAQQHRETVAGTSGDPNAVAPGASPYQVQNYFIAPNLIKIPLSISLFQTHSFLKKFVALAIDRAIREIISPVVDRSVTIACFTTRELVSKDFAVEGDEKKMRRAAHQMVQNLTSSLALVTCKEHLRGSIVSHLRSLLMDNSNPSELKLAEVEDACEKVALRNLDLGCQLIEKAASDRAVSQIDEALAAALRMRRVHREQTGQMFCDMSVFQPSRFPPSFPDFLRPKPRPEGLSATQLRVYEDFTRIRQGTRPSPAGSPYVSAADGVPDLPSSEPMPDLMKQGEQPTNRLRTQSTLDRLLACLQNVEHAVSAVPNHRSMRLASLGRSSMTEQIHSYLSMIPVILNQTVEATDQPPAEVMALTFANKVFKQLYDREHRNSLLQVDVHLHILECVRHKYPKVVNELTMMLLYTASDDRKFLIDITCGLIRVRMLVLPELDQYVAKLVHSVHHTNKAVQSNGNRITLHPHLEFAINLVRRVVVKESTVMATELPHLIEALRLLANAYQTRHAPLSEHLSALIDEMRLSSRASEFDTMKENITRELKSAPVDDDEPELEFVSTVYNEEMGHGTKQTILAFLDEWMSMATSGFTESSNTLEQFLERLHKSNMFSTPKTSVQFFCVVAQACVEAAYVYPNAPKSPPPGTVHNTLNAKQQAMAAQLESQAIAQSQGLLSYMAIDALSRLIVWLVKELDPPALGNSSPQNPLASRINLLSLFLTAVVCIMLKDFEAKGERFNQRPYLRLLSGLLTDLNRPDPVKFDSNQDGVLLAFANCLRLLRPTKVPVFAFAWIELLAHRMFMSKMLFSKEPQCQIQFQRLLLDLFVLMQPYLHNAELTQSIKLLYNGTLRILLVLLHDFPQFLCDFHFSFCDVIPPTCIQLRNLILSAFPKNMSLPDPFTPDLQMEALDGIQIKPRIVSEWYLVLKAYNAPLVTPLVQYIQDRGPPSLFDQITRALSFQNTCSNPVELARTVKRAGTHYNLPLINSMVLYLGGERPWTDACMDVFKALMTTLDAEGRYYVLSAIVNQLRYPNNHTYQFSRVLLSLFLNTEELIVKEQITRVLLERLIVHSPHPWGLLITFIELIKHEQYDFWAFPFIHCSPDIKRLFDCVARSCMQGPK
jgi:CCR4-NOT transcription complex subunit 1